MNNTRRCLSRLSSFMTMFLLASLTLLSGCGGGNSPPTSTTGTPAVVANLAVSPPTGTGTTGQTLSFVVSGGTPGYTVIPSNRDWVSVSSVSSAGGNYIFTATLGSTQSSSPTQTTLIVADSANKTTTIPLTVSAVPLRTTAPSAVTISKGGGEHYTISGGTAPYTATSSNGASVSASVSSATLTINGLTTGTANVVVYDAAGTSITVAVTVGNSTTPIPLYTTAPSAVTIFTGTTAQYTIAGGTAPYTVTSSNVAVVTVGISSDTVTVRGLVAGTANVVVHDAAGASVAIAVTVGNSVTPTPLYMTAPGAITMATGRTVRYTVAGGTSPYTANSSNEAVATVIVNSPTITITAVKAGTANIVVYDAAGTLFNPMDSGVSIAVTVADSAGAALYTNAPMAITISAIGGARSFAIGGGTQPYACTSSNTNVASVNSNCTAGMTITGLADGTANIQVQDSTGSSSLTIAVNVATGGGFTVIGADTTWTIPVGHCTASPFVPYAPPAYSVYFINGGTPPYTVQSTTPLVGSIIGTDSTMLTKPTSAASVVFGSVTVGAGGYFVVAWPDTDNECAFGNASFKVIDSTGLLSSNGAAVTFKVNVQ